MDSVEDLLKDQTIGEADFGSIESLCSEMKKFIDGSAEKYGIDRDVFKYCFLFGISAGKILLSITMKNSNLQKEFELKDLEDTKYLIENL